MDIFAEEQITALGDLVTVWAHPDDETYLAAGVMGIAAANGARVTCITATSGELGVPGCDRTWLAARRTAELRAALSEIGVHDLVVLGEPDGACADIDPRRPTAEIGRIIRDRRPATVITFGADGLTGHPDHRAVSCWTSAALSYFEGRAPRLLHTAVTHEFAAEHADIDEQFEIYAPGLPALHERHELAIHLELVGPWLDAKLRALRAHESQTSGLIAAIGEDRYRSWVAVESFLQR
ncbi:MAG: PIG-L deacetylase family protein [Acidimicrobiia bacterium]